MADPCPIATDVDARDRRDYLESLGFELEDGKWRPPPSMTGFTEWVDVFGSPWRQPFIEVLHARFAVRPLVGPLARPQPHPGVPTWAVVLVAILFEAASAVPGKFTVGLVAEALAWCANAANPAEHAGAIVSLVTLGADEANLRSMNHLAGLAGA